MGKIFTFYEVKHRVSWDRFESQGKFATLAAARNYIKNANQMDLSITEHVFTINPDNTITDSQTTNV